MAEYTDLAPEIVRQRLVVEGIPAAPITEQQIKSYLSGLSTVCDMSFLQDPVTHLSPLYGWAGWIHWETSGTHFYAWDVPRLFFSVDIYTCKRFDVASTVKYTEEFFKASTITYKSF
jgi:S-adenosylmethionine decarboxylase